MIAALRVRDLATVAEATLALGPGLNVLTGETGAGKSMLVDALALLLGERADSGLVRAGTARAVVEGVFEGLTPETRARVEALGLDVVDDRLVVRREISAEGRSRAWVNGSPTTAAVLGDLGRSLADLHGQHETQSLLRPEAQRDILDAWAGALPHRAAVAEAHAGLAALRQEEAALLQRRDDIRRRADYLRHVAAEIDRAALQPGEDEALQLEARRLSHAGLLGEQAHGLARALDGGEASALEALGRAERALAALERVDPAVAAWRELLDAAFANLGELAREAEGYAEGISDDPGRLEAVERRRDLLATLGQKYGPGLEGIQATRREAGAELEVLDTADLDLRTLAARRAAAEAGCAAAAAALTERRAGAADRLARAVNRLLPRLGMPEGRIRVELPALSAPGPTGAEAVEFHAALNPGHDARPLARSASGGELSRIMLALKAVLAHEDAVPTLVFDEVDQGIGGEAGAAVGLTLAEVAGRRQVLVVTHLPQIAARADRHVVVSKRLSGGVALSEAQVIHGEDRVIEIARMLGDADAATARRHAQALLSTPARTRAR